MITIQNVNLSVYKGKTNKLCQAHCSNTTQNENPKKRLLCESLCLPKAKTNSEKFIKPETRMIKHALHEKLTFAPEQLR